MSDQPSALTDLLKDEAWLEKFCTYKQLRSIIHQRESHGSLKPIKLVIEPDTEQNFITVFYHTGEKFTF